MTTKKGKKIAVVEDDKALANMYVERLSAEGYDVILATDGEMAIEIIQSQSPDFIILDIMLPKKNGFEVLEIVRKHPIVTNTPVVVLSAFPRDDYKEKVNSFGADGFFDKAVATPGDITNLVNKILFPELS